MATVVTKACISVKDKACMEGCPTDCFHEGADQLYIDPDSCIDCGHCIPLCPVNAIFLEADVPADRLVDIERNARVFTDEHLRGCGCGYCDPATGRATGRLPMATPRAR
jgi:ferredoxin